MRTGCSSRRADDEEDESVPIPGNGLLISSVRLGNAHILFRAKQLTGFVIHKRRRRRTYQILLFRLHMRIIRVEPELIETPSDVELTQEAWRDLHHAVLRDAARTRESGSYDNVADVEKDAEETEVEAGENRHNDAY